jgi:hypothetical protein
VGKNEVSVGASRLGTRSAPRSITTASIEKVCQRARVAAGLGKDITAHTLRHYADFRIMATETTVIVFFEPFRSTLDSACVKATRHNPDIPSFEGVASDREVMIHAQPISPRCISMSLRG